MSALRWSAGRPSLRSFFRCRIMNTVEPLAQVYPACWRRGAAGHIIFQSVLLAWSGACVTHDVHCTHLCCFSVL